MQLLNVFDVVWNWICVAYIDYLLYMLSEHELNG